MRLHFKKSSTLYRLLPVIIIGILIIILFHSVLFPPNGQMIFGGDIQGAYYFWKGFLQNSILSGNIPFWNPYNFSGTPFLAHPNINFFYPPNWLFVVLPLNASFSWYFAFHLFVAGVSMYWLCRKYTGRFGAFLAGFVYAFGGFFVARVYSGHLEYVDAASWIPLVFGLTRDAFLKTSVKPILKAGIGFGILFLCGNELFMLFSLEMLALYGIFRIFRSVKKRNLSIIWKIPIAGLAAIIIGASISAIELIPRYEFLSQSLRSEGVPYSVAGTGSLPIEGLKLFINPYVWGSAFQDSYTYSGPWPNLFEYLHYIGILPPLLILGFAIYLILRKIFHRSDTKIHSDFWFFLLIAIPVFILISLGASIAPNIHELLWKYTPLYKGIRFPARHLFLVAFSASLLTGLVINTIRPVFLKLLIVIVVVINLLIFDMRFITLTPVPTTLENQKLITMLSKDKNYNRILPDYSVVSEVRKDMDFGSSAIHQIFSTSDYNSMILFRYYDFIDLANKATESSIPYYNVEIPPLSPSSAYINFLNISYLLSDKNNDSVLNGNIIKYKLISDEMRYRLYKNVSVLPRYFFVYDAYQFNQTKELRDALRGNTYDLTKIVLFSKEDDDAAVPTIKCDNKDTGKVNIIDYGINRITLNVSNDCDGFLIGSDVYYPGWKSNIDGKISPVYQANYAFRSLFVPKGTHRVEIYYDPFVWYIGGLISVITICSIIFFWKRNET